MFDIPIPVFEDRPRYTPLPPENFSTTSLTEWLAYVEKADVPHISATVLANLSIDDLLRSDEINNESAQETYQKLKDINKSLAPGYMLRWDPCAGLNVKEAMAYGREPKDYGLDPMEPRTFDILYETPNDHVAVLLRPWLSSRIFNSYPVEFRVYVNDGEIVAAANYYLQRDLPDTPENRSYVKQAIEMTQKILSEVKKSGRTPAFMRQSNPGEGFACSLDFIVAEDGRVLFLEAGPGFGFGAHPCAFLNPDKKSVEKVEGVQLASGATPIPFSNL